MYVRYAKTMSLASFIVCMVNKDLKAILESHQFGHDFDGIRQFRSIEAIIFERNPQPHIRKCVVC